MQTERPRPLMSVPPVFYMPDTTIIHVPEITLEGTLSGNNLSKILDNLNAASASEPKTKADAPAGQKKAKKFIVKDLVINGARVNANVSALGQSLNTGVTIPDIHLT